VTLETKENFQVNQEATDNAPPKRVHIETWGCQMNVADSERMLSMLASHNYKLTDTAEDADLVLLNTCHIREKAKHKVLSRLGKLKEIKNNKPGMQIAVTGCVAQAEGRKLQKAAPQIDVMVGPGKIDELPRLIKENQAQGRFGIAVGFKKEGNQLDKEIITPPSLTGKNEVSRFVNIQQGCNNCCTFCVVPFTRGKEISRTPDAILSECRQLIDKGAKEITLLGQNVNSYGMDLVDKASLESSSAGPFFDLLSAASTLPGLDRLRFTTSNPHDFSEPLANLFATHSQLGRYIHLPVQSGNDTVLERMKRKVTVDEYWQRINWLRQAVPDMAISTDLIVGFPGETEEQFEDTVKLVEAVRYSFIFSFKYSPRNNTVAKRMQDQVPEAEMNRRLKRLNDVQNAITIEQNLAEIGQDRAVLILYESRKEPGIFYGRTEHFRLVRVASQRDITGTMVATKIIDANKTALVGALV
jgi:tRNA-2-methylthio-N6-dimethylallyladenosine synthase